MKSRKGASVLRNTPPSICFKNSAYRVYLAVSSSERTACVAIAKHPSTYNKHRYIKRIHTLRGTYRIKRFYAEVKSGRHHGRERFTSSSCFDWPAHPDIQYVTSHPRLRHHHFMYQPKRTTKACFEPRIPSKNAATRCAESQPGKPSKAFGYY